MEKDRNKYSGAIWNTIGVALNSFLSFFFLIIVTRVNGIEASGNFSFLFTVSLLLFTIATYGGRVYQVSDEKKEFSFENYLTSKIFSTIAAILIMIIFMLANGNSIDLQCILLFLVVTKIVETFSDVYYGVFQRHNRLDCVGISMTIKSVLSILAFFIIDIVTKNIVLATTSLFISNLLVYWLYDCRILKKYQIKGYDFGNKTRKVLLVTKYIFLFNFLTILIINIPRYMVNIFLDKEMQGYFGIIIMIPTVLSLFGQFIIQPSLVELSKCYNKGLWKAYLKILKTSCFLILAITAVCLGCAYFLGPQVLQILYGIDFSEYRIILLIAILGGAFNVITSVLSVNLTVMRETKKQFLLYAITFVIGSIVSYYLIRVFLMDGVFVSYLITMMIQAGLFFILFVFRFRQSKKEIENIGGETI